MASEELKETGAGRRWLRWMRWPGLGGTGYESSRNLARWLVLGTAIGAVAGLGAVVLFASIDWMTQAALGGIAGWDLPRPAGEGAPAASGLPHRRWVLPALVGLGGLLSGLLVFRLAPEAEGHGTDAAIDAIHRHGSRIRARIPLVKLVASAVTIGTGGSAGREGPAAQISAGFGSLLGGWLRLSPHDRRIAVAAGIGAGIGAIFRAPLGGALLAAEILYVHDIEVEAILPALIASIVGFTIYGAVNGYGPIFGAHPFLDLGAPIQLLYYAGLGVLGGVGGILYARAFYGVGAVFRRARWPGWLRPAIGGAAAGLLGVFLPQILHTGYGWVQSAMTREGLLGMPLAMVLVLPAAKVLATSLTIGSGGSGGIFGPGMFIGGMLGAAAWRLGEGLLPSLPPEPAPFVIIGMMAFFGGIAHAPLAVMLMVAEMTGTLSLLAPAMIAVAISTAIVGDETIYRGQLRDRSVSPHHRARLAFPVLLALQVRSAVESAGAAGEGTGGPALTVDTEETLYAALGKLTEAGAAHADVVDAEGRKLGVVTARGILRTYASAIERARRSAPLPPQADVVALRVGPASPVVGRTLAEVQLPADALVVGITRAGSFILPRGSTRFAAGDLVTLLTTARGEAPLAKLLGGGPA